jgi:diguanylate cyclase (GGDEF)-like protein
MLHDRMARFDRTRTADAVPALLMIDLDGFKAVNDTLGHAAGDDLLIEIAGRLRAVADTVPGALPTRLGGDEFAVLFTAGGRGAAVGTAQRVLAAVAAPVMLAGRAVVVRASVGIAVGRDPATEARQLLSEADLALYQAKDHGKDCYREYDPDQAPGLERRRNRGFGGLATTATRH